MKKKILFLTPDFGPGAAERVEVNPADGMERSKSIIAVSFLPDLCSCVAGGYPEDGTKTVCRVHTAIPGERKYQEGFRNKSEADRCHNFADTLVFMPEDAKKAFLKFYDVRKMTAFSADRRRYCISRIIGSGGMRNGKN